MKSQFPNHSADSADISESYLQKFEDCHVFYSHNDHIFTISSTSQYAEMISSLACYFKMKVIHLLYCCQFFGHMKKFYLINCLYLVGLGIPPACL